MVRPALIFVLIMLSVCANGQDIHFSEFYASPINLNPALTGQFEGTVRAGIGYRDQYRAVAAPYQTLSVFTDFRDAEILGKNHAFGYGLLLNGDVAGDAGMGTYQVGLPFALHFGLSPKDILSLGAVPSMNMLNIRRDDLRFGDQFNGFQYKDGSVSAESAELQNPIYFSLAAGINYTHRISQRASASGGISVNNINTPQQTFYQNGDAELPMRFNLHGLYRFALGDDIDALPLVRYSMQSSHREFLIGGQIYHYLPQLTVQAINYGLSFRAMDYDAVIAHIGFVYYLFYVGLNYDINVSQLSTVSNNRGAFEMHGIMYFDRSKLKKKRRSVSCPGNF